MDNVYIRFGSSSLLVVDHTCMHVSLSQTRRKMKFLSSMGHSLWGVFKIK